MSVIQAWMLAHQPRHAGPPGHPLTPAVVCADGFRVSVQAGYSAYSSPRASHGPWTHLEAGFPSEPVESWLEFAEDPERPCCTVYAYVPIVLIDDAIAAHGGLDPRLQLALVPGL